MIFLVNFSQAAGPPLDLSGEWEAIPQAFLRAEHGGGPYDKLSLRLTHVQPLPHGRGRIPYEFRYTGRYLKYERHFISTKTPPDCAGTQLEDHLHAVPYLVNFTSIWHVATLTDEIFITSIHGYGEVDLPRVPSPHGELQKGLEFNRWTAIMAPPTSDAHARFDRRYERRAGAIPTDRCTSISALPNRDHGGAQMWKVSAAPAELNLTGTIKGQVKSLHPVTTDRSDYEVHRAQVFLYRQTQMLRLKRNEESDVDYARYLAFNRVLARPAAVLTPDQDGNFEFKDLPILGLRPEGPVSYWKPVRYTVQVVSAETDELVISGPVIDPDKTEVLYFQPEEVINVLPTTTLAVKLRPFTGLNAKLDLVEDITELGPENFGPIEGRVRTYLNRLADVPGGVTPAQEEGLRRAIWAERLVRDSARYSDELLSAGLKAFASLMADAIGDLKRWESEGVADARKALAQVRAGSGNPRLPSQFNINDTSKLSPRWQEMIQRGQRTEMTDELIKLVKAARVVVQEGLIYAGMDAQTASRVALGLEHSHLIILNYIRNQTGRGIAKDLIKLALKEYLDDVLKPRLFDSSLPYSHTSLVAPDLEYSAARLMDWNRSNQEAYLTDRAVVAERLSRLSTIASDILRWAIFWEATALVGDTSQKVFGAAAAIPPARVWAKAFENFSRGLKYVANGEAAAGSAIFVFWGAPKLVREGVYGAFGEQPPARQSAQSFDPPRLSALAENPPIVLPATNQFRTAVLNLVGLIRSNQIGAALEMAGSIETNGYARARATWKRQVDIFELQGASVNVTAASTAGNPLLRLQEAKAILLTARTKFESSFQELFRHVLLAPEAATNDPIYLAAKNEVVATSAGLLDELGNFHETVQGFPSEWGRWQLLPALMIDLLEPAATNEIATIPQEFIIRARVSNLTFTGASNVQARLTIVSSNENVTVSTPLVRTAGSGTLGRADALVGAGDDEAIVEWVVHYGSSGSLQPLAFQIDLLEGDAEPTTFVSAARSGSLPLSAELYDRDLDGLPDSWEREHGLNPDLDDAGLDLDSDGLTNIEEFRLGLKPHVADFDSDGLLDGEEVAGGADGFVTNLRLADSDGDGVPDNLDGHPVDETSTTRPADMLEPVVAVDQSRVVLSQLQPFAIIHVTNHGSGLLQWGATAENPGLVVPNVLAPALTTADLLLLRLPSGASLRNFGTALTTIRVHDLGGATPDAAEIQVFISGEFGAPLVVSLEPGSRNVVLSWTAVADRQYQVEYSEDLLVWKKPADGLFSPTAAGTVWTWTDGGPPATDAPPGDLEKRFYRVIPR